MTATHCFSSMEKLPILMHFLVVLLMAIPSLAQDDVDQCAVGTSGSLLRSNPQTDVLEAILYRERGVDEL